MLVSNNNEIYAGQAPIIKVYSGTNVVYEKQITPSYTELNYIQSDKAYSQSINPDLPNYTDGFRVELKWAPMNTSRNQFIYGSEGTSTPARNYFKYSSSTALEVGAYNYFPFTYTTQLDTPLETEVNTIKNTTQYVKINGTTVWSGGSYTGYDRVATTPYIFALNRGGSVFEPSSIKLYYIKFYDSEDTLLRDFIPVLDSNNVPCLYDKVSNTYFYNQGSGTFLYE